jgi:hypothetical protein
VANRGKRSDATKSANDGSSLVVGLLREVRPYANVARILRILGGGIDAAAAFLK